MSTVIDIDATAAQMREDLQRILITDLAQAASAHDRQVIEAQALFMECRIQLMRATAEMSAQQIAMDIRRQAAADVMANMTLALTLALGEPEEFGDMITASFLKAIAKLQTAPLSELTIIRRALS